MLESIVSSFLNRFLGDYFENFSSENLNVGILSGIATVENLHMTSTALQTMLNAPLKVTDGKLSKLHLQIPWTGTFKLLSFSLSLSVNSGQKIQFLGIDLGSFLDKKIQTIFRMCSGLFVQK